MPTIEAEVTYQRVMESLHDAVIYRPGGPRYATNGRRNIKPMGSKMAGEVIGHSHGYVRKLLSLECPKHDVTLKHLVMWLLAGMDTAPLDELESAVGRVAFAVPECDGHDDLHMEAVRVGKEVGDVFAKLQQITDEDSAGGSRITRREAESLAREAREACAAVMALVQAVEECAR